MTNVLMLPTALIDLTTHTAETVVPAGGLRVDFQAELSIAATRFEFAVGVGAMLGGLVGLGVGAVGGCIIGAAPASAVGAVLGGAALGIPVGIYSLVQFNNAVGQLAA
ncbi:MULTISPECIES: hypothetical protein [unclassified Mycolicibacterium]|uniref:hypothetical protein n=1 Tax=unclassified Mycolicibacterium TaxID=2636767 RepID=UPI0012DE8626|nr:MULTISPECIES: hypothetical protein [unclassified Mycolicibacterium]MUL82290.1 hypothetical protein [Mycolicibacterium sp. CBMA 329]MUL88056.1 hypothetical protein [Mycolicibacterium sp. CBMA 331]MUM02386.1 hypothetical protein [Mycolicibacterium sp. CBMA 334]MUM30218.1 hypothetical protein [Mycolicibacterium sp. CBMA 295]MUM38353.1 hypothetical protein [Mycolicibacterium sp. CBMA 247]